VPKNRIKKLLHSVFFRLLIAIILAGIALTIIILIKLSSLKQDYMESLAGNLTRYTHYLVKEIGTPPSHAKALAIARDTQMVIRYHGSNKSWTVPEDKSIPNFGKHYHQWYHQNGMIIGSNFKGHFIKLTNNDGQLFFWLGPNREVEKKAVKRTILFFSAFVIILIAAYLYIRRVMQPIHWLTTAMNEFGSGNLSYRMPLKRDDEFQDLAKSMNKMAAQIEGLMQAKESLLLDVSHELRSPIARLKVGLELLKETEAKISLQEDLREMEAMVTEILEAYRLHRYSDRLKLEEVESNALIDSVIAEFSGRPPGIKAIDLCNCRIQLDLKKARVVLRNILDNALKYSSKSSRPVEVTSGTKNDLLTIRIKDFGLGIPAHLLNQVFEPFFRVDPSRSRQSGGFGLGLSMCKAIMEAHHGTIHIESNAGKGTLVVINFPNRTE
jgi:signal transduction histidine kinase